MEKQLKILEIFDISLKRKPMFENAVGDQPQPACIMATAKVEMMDAISLIGDTPVIKEFATRILMTSASEGLASCETRVARHLAQELRAVADALDAWQPQG